MWSSAPNLNFQMDSQENDDPFLSFDEPDFSKSAANLGYDFNAELDEDDMGFGEPQMVSPRVKVKASHLSDMKTKEKEIKNLFSQWKQTTKHVGGNCVFPDLSPTSPTKSPTRTTKKMKKKELMKLHTCPPSFDSDGSPAQKSSPTKRKKKVAVKLKARDLNLSKSKQEEIEQMFWKWKGQVKDPAALDPMQQIAAGAEDQRWTEPSRDLSANRPKPALRQQSISGNEATAQGSSDDSAPEKTIKRLAASSREQSHPLRSRSRSSGRPERQPSEERPKVRRLRSGSRDSHNDDGAPGERSKSRGHEQRRSRSKDMRRRSRAESRSKSRTRSKDSERDEDVTRSKSRSRSTSSGRYEDPSRSKSQPRSSSERDEEEEPWSTSQPRSCSERDADVLRSKSRSRSKSRERDEEEEPWSTSQPRSCSERDVDVLRSKSRSRSKSREHSEDEEYPEDGPRRRSKSTSRRPSYIRRARSNESMESTVSATRSGRKPSHESDNFVGDNPFPL